MTAEQNRAAQRKYYAAHRTQVLAMHSTVYGRLMNQRRMAYRRLRKAKTEGQRARALLYIERATATIEAMQQKKSPTGIDNQPQPV
jgi:hypothetical protein